MWNDGKYYLLVIGGQGPSVNTPQQDTAQYIKFSRSNVHTNEQHYFNLSTGKYTEYHYCGMPHCIPSFGYNINDMLKFKCYLFQVSGSYQLLVEIVHLLVIFSH